ncbi:MAG: cobaltochelatase subunit CobN, partial [Pseudomonadota bacterium]
MRDETMTFRPYRVVIITLDRHVEATCQRAAQALAPEFPGLELIVHAAAEWGEDPAALEAARADVARGDIVVTNLLFLEEQIEAIRPDLESRRDACDAMVGLIADAKIVKLTRMGTLDMSAPESATRRLLKKLRGSSNSKFDSGAKKMAMLRRLPKLLKLIPGKAQDLRAWFLMMQYWLGASDDNVEAMVRFLISRYCRFDDWRGARVAAPIDYPDCGLYHPDLPAATFPGHITEKAGDLPNHTPHAPTVGLVMMRSYVLSGDTAHYDAVIRGMEARGLNVLPAFAGGLDARPAIESFFEESRGPKIDALVSLTGFSLVGGPAYNDNDSAIKVLKRLDVPYLAAHPLEFQTLEQWEASPQGLGPIETTMLIALPELDGATCPTVFAGRHGPDAESSAGGGKAMAPCTERITSLVEKTERLVRLRRRKNTDSRVAIVLFGFPPNAGAVGTAAYLSVFESLHNTMQKMQAEGYDIEVPPSVDALRSAVLDGNAAQYGQEANVAAHVSADQIVARTPNLVEIEEVWGPAPGKAQSDGRGVFILGKSFGKVFVGVQPTFGYEGDPMRLLFERGFAPTHAFVQFYLWLRNTFEADAILHFGMHGALEFMPGKQAGLGARDWPDRLIGDMPNVYLYASNNPSEATLAKRRSGAVTVTHLTPPLSSAGLYKGLAELKDSLTRWRETAPDAPEREEIETLIAEQADAVDLGGQEPETLW